MVCFSVIAFFKDDLNLSKGIVYKTKNATLKTLKIDLNKDKVYLAIGDEYQLKADIETNKNKEMNIVWSSNDENIVTVSNGLAKGIAKGEATVKVTTADNITKEIEVIVSDLITTAKINESKKYLSCERYSEEEANLLDEILFDRINEAGYGTRMGPVTAARFLLLEFPYRIAYFNENGRLKNYGGPKVDGEGRYYHRGLYLHKSKFDLITHTMYGPAIWGCNLWDSFLARYKANGFTCSGFVTWTLLNGGFDVGDVGAGDYPDRNDDVSDLGDRLPITKELLKSGKIKVGDLIGRDGHAAIIIGIDEEYFYVAESLPPQVQLVKMTYDGVKLIHKGNGVFGPYNDYFSFIIPMDHIYKNDGNYSEMW